MRRFITLLAIGLTSFLYYSCSDTQPVSSVDSDKSGIVGTVVTSEDAKPLEGALVKLSGNSMDMETKSNQDGDFEFTSLEKGEYEITIYLPMGYKNEAENKKEVLVDGMSEVQFTVIPIKEDERVINAGSVDTLATVSGSLLMVDATNSNSDINVEIREVEEDRFGDVKSLSKQIEIVIGSNGDSNLQLNNYNKTDEDSFVDFEFIIPFSGDTEETILAFNSGTKDEPFYTYADGERISLMDPISGNQSTAYSHAFSTPSTYNLNTTTTATNRDLECSNDYRDFYKIDNSMQGETPLILIHGLKPTEKECEAFLKYYPETETFQSLITELEHYPEISQNYQLYIYKYPSITHIEDNSKELLDHLKELDEAVVIAHSMGGLVARRLMQDDDSQIKELITLGTPHYGSPIADLANDVSKKNRAHRRLCNPEPNFPGCAAFLIDTYFIPETRGLSDLVTDSDFIENLDSVENIYTFGGLLNNINDIKSDHDIGTSSTYKLGYRYMDEILETSGDGMVETSSSMPDWSNSIHELSAHDHTEMVEGMNGDISMIFEKIEPILMSFIENGSESEAPEEGLIAYFPFNDTNNDKSENNNDGSITGNVTFTDGQKEEAAKFGGIDNPGFITVSDALSLSFDGQASFSMWARFDGSFGQTGSDCSGDGVDSANQIMIAKSGDRYGFILYGVVNENGKVRLISSISDTGISNSNFAGTSGQSEIEEGEWFHVVFTLDQTGTYIYVNGDLLAKDDRPADFRVANDEDMYFGIQKGKGSCLPYWWPFDGALDEVRIYNRSLTEAEIQDIYRE